ncbi:MAG: colanic acid biosynthesis glycosyltransferase WcaL [Planctomycetota bacterium]|nr:MAG: colanic acid biosynthesis glycosyltransferase WcaL [Planctomycetota bacterium]
MCSLKVGYVLKRYPRLSETFILNEILAHEAAGLQLHIFSLREPEPGPQHEDVKRVRAGVSCLPREPMSARDLGEALIAASDRLIEEEVELDLRSSKQVRLIWQARQIARQARELGLNHLHAHFATDASTMARWAGLQAGITYSFTAHAKDIFHESVKTEHLRRLARDAAGIVTVSDFNVRHLKTVLNGDACPIHRIYNGLDLSAFPYDTSTRQPGRIVAVGRLVEKKGFDDLLRACAVMKSAGRSFHCELIGDGEQREMLESLRTDLALSDCVEMTGALPREEVVARIRRASVMAAPCVVGKDGNRDGLPTVILEAQALGTPCVSTPVTGIPEAVHHETTGLIVPERDPKALAAALGRVLDAPDFGRKLAEGARRLIEESFDLHRNTAEMRAMFEAAAAAGAPR